MTCEFVLDRRLHCRQNARGISGLCTYHQRAAEDPGFPHDPYYHEKILKGLTQPTDDYLTTTEVDTLFGGRNHHDGRRLDHYTKL